MVERIYLHPHDVAKDDIAAIYIPLPAEVARPIESGCDCAACKANPGAAPRWDTLAVALDDGHTWTVHWPEIATRGVPFTGGRMELLTLCRRA